MLLWLSSRAALTSLASGSPLSKLDDPKLQDFVLALNRRGVEAVAAALDRHLQQRAAAFISGVETYRRHPFSRGEQPRPVRWSDGAARLLDYGRHEIGKTVLLVPSLINRHYILDLLPERSFAGYLADSGLRPLVLDWGEPGPAERRFNLDDYISGPLQSALLAAVELAGEPVAVAGYCMGGLLALAGALRAPAKVAGLALLATPWDFHAERPIQSLLLASLAEWLPRIIAEPEPVPISIIQSLFVALDPFLGERKFVRFAAMPPAGDAARGFVALEDWINDGVPLARGVALDCARSWYRDNQPARGIWQVAGQPVTPQQITAPALVVLPSSDRIVPPAAAEPLAAAIPHADTLRPSLGHIGMMSSARAPEVVWRPIANWLHGCFDMPHRLPT